MAVLSVSRAALLVVILFMIPVFYTAFKFLACVIEIMMSLATMVNQKEVLFAKQLDQSANAAQAAGETAGNAMAKINAVKMLMKQFGFNFKVRESTFLNLSYFRKNLKKSFEEALSQQSKQISVLTKIFPGFLDYLETFKSRTCVVPEVLLEDGYSVNYQPSPFVGTGQSSKFSTTQTFLFSGRGN